MSTLRSLKKPKKHKKNILYVIISGIVIAAIILGICLLSKSGGYQVPSAEIRTEIVKD